MFFRKKINVILKNKHLKNIVRVSKKGNFAILTALLLPLVVLISGTSIDLARYFFCKNMIEEVIAKSIEEETDNICVNQPTIETSIRHHMKTNLLNNLEEQDINLLLMNTKIKLKLISRTRNTYEYEVSVHSFYSIEPNAMTKALAIPSLTEMKMEIYIHEKIKCPNISGIIMANINIWRPENARDDTTAIDRFNKFEKDHWKASFNVFINKIKKFAKEKNVSFYILSGNMTDFGEEAQTNLFIENYLKLSDNNIHLNKKIIVYPSLGPAEYMNNRGICTIEDFVLGENGCAFNSIRRLWNEVKEIRDGHHGDDINWDSRYTMSTSYFLITRHIIKKSQSYSWNIGNLHFIQTNNSLFNAVQFGDLFSRIYVEIDPLIYHNGKVSDWLIQDINKAKSQNKHIIIIGHDIENELYKHNYKHNHEQYDAFRNLVINSNISAIISTSNTHTNYQLEFGQVPTYYIGPAWNKNFVLFEMKNKRTINFTFFQEHMGEMNKIGEETLHLH